MTETVMQPEDRLSGFWKLGLCALIVGVVFHRVAPTLSDPDLWGHLRFGLDLAREGFITTKDPYSYLSDRDWINHEWLSELIFAGAYRGAGPGGLVLLKVLVSMLLFGGLYRHLCRNGFGVFRGGMVVLIVLFPTSIGLKAIRPHLFTYLGFFLMLVIIKNADRGRIGWLLAAPPLLLVWTNLHGGFLAGLGIFAIWLAALMPGAPKAPALFSAPLGTSRALAAGALALSGLATLANPYGFHLLTFLARTAALPRPEIQEWHPLPLLSRLGAAYLLMVGLSGFALIKTRQPRSISLVVPLTVTALLPLVALRHLPLFALAFGVLAADHLADAFSRKWPEERLGRPGDHLRGPFLGASAIAFVTLVATGVQDLGKIQLDPTSPMPVQSVALLKESGVEGNLAVFFDWGEYAIWHLGPNVQVSIDGRRETVYSGKVLLENLSFLYGQNEWDALLENHPTDLVLIGKKSAAFNLMKLKTGWQSIREDEVSGLFARENSEVAQRILSTPQPGTSGWPSGLTFP